MLAIFRNAAALAAALAATRFIPDRFVLPLGIVAAVLLAVYLLNLLLKLRGANADPSAKGCLVPVAMITAAMLALLIVGLAFHIQFLAYAISVVTAVAVLFLIPDMIKMTLRKWKENRRK